MATYDLTEAARAIRATQASYSDDQERLARWWDEGLTSPEDVRIATRQARAALPHIERQVREQVAREILRELARKSVPVRTEVGVLTRALVDVQVLDLAARIARGEQA